MELEGYDYEELIDKWGLRKKYKKLYKAISRLGEAGIISKEEMFNLHEEAGEILITEYIIHSVSYDQGNTSIDPDVRNDMLEILDKLSSHAVCSRGDADMYHAIATLGENPETTFEFYRWFVHCLPLMWN